MPAQRVRKLILKCDLSLGDIVLLTAAVRDLHAWYPGQFITDIRTFFPDVWSHNPCITPIQDDDPDAELIVCSYPLIDFCNEAPYHAIHGFIEFLNRKLRLGIKATLFKGDIHLTPQEKAWFSQVHEVTGEAIPFWIVAAGGKYDVTIKWWDAARYQAVIDHFRGKIQFVQVGQRGHHHPRLDGVIDFRGKTTIRELIRLVYHASGVFCGVTALMHLAAAVPIKRSRRGERPCVVVAGGREPAHWEAYPGHQFIHTNGALSCCVPGGCWKNRSVRLRDGDRRDAKKHLCVDVVNHLPRCMDMISPGEVIRRIDLYFAGGTGKFLDRRQRIAAEEGIRATGQNEYDQQPLNLSSAGSACDKFIKTIPRYPEVYQGRGIVICGGGIRYFTCAWVCIHVLRDLGCTLPVQFWYLGEEEMDRGMVRLFESLGVKCIDALQVRRKHPARRLAGWELKPYAIIHSAFRQVLLLDADNVPVVNPEFLFETAQFRNYGAIFWPDYNYGKNRKARNIWRSCGLRQPGDGEFETGQIVVDKQRCWAALKLTLWFNENSDFYYQYVHGDKETFHLAFRKLRQRYALIQTPIESLQGTMCQHDFNGRRIFQHRNSDKWDLFLRNKRVRGFLLEDRCREHIRRLRERWDGRISDISQCLKLRANRPCASLPKIEAVMISRAARESFRQQTLRNLIETDWDGAPVHVRIFTGKPDELATNETEWAWQTLASMVERDVDYILVLEDDLRFNSSIRHNLLNWPPVVRREVTLASLYNPWIRELACDLENHCRVVDPRAAFGSQAFLISKPALNVVGRWKRAEGPLERRIWQLAGLIGKAVFFHAPSLVEHLDHTIERGGIYDRAMDFDPMWRTGKTFFDTTPPRISAWPERHPAGYQTIRIS